MPAMRRIAIDGARWATPADFYAALLPALGSPEWHGGNLDALFDALGGGILEVEAPFTVAVSGSDQFPEQLAHYMKRVEGVFADARAEFDTAVFITLG